jgi:peptidoglycan/LPS O-acetylase OafA/YrhL
MLSGLARGRNNNLDFLRLVASSAVLWSHSFILAGQNEYTVFFFQRDKDTYGVLGVYVFFLLSGFLITQSYLSSNSPLRFLWSRVLRILPALICVILITVFILGPLLTDLSLKEYFLHPTTRSYLKELGTFDRLPGLFAHNPYPLAVNGSLWTLRYEFGFYLVVLLFGLTGMLRRRTFVLLVFIAALVLNFLGFGKSTNIYIFNVFQIIQFFVYFSLGMVIYLYREYIPIHWKIVAVAAALLVVTAFFKGFNNTFPVLMIACIIFFTGYYPKINLTFFTRNGDYSYGIYIWAFLVQQTIVHLFPGKINPWVLFLLAGLTTYTIGALSWHLVEKRMLRLKSIQLPGRRIGTARPIKG